jgi:hypothetical protein
LILDHDYRRTIESLFDRGSAMVAAVGRNLGSGELRRVQAEHQNEAFEKSNNLHDDVPPITGCLALTDQKGRTRSMHSRNALTPRAFKVVELTGGPGAASRNACSRGLSTGSDAR